MALDVAVVHAGNDRGQRGARWCTPQDREAAHLVEGLIRHLGEDPQREGLLRTPERVVQSMRYLTRGYEESLDDLVNGAVFAESYSELVAVTNIEFYSLCEHHLLPFYGQAHVGYIPDGQVIGLSKLPRIVDVYARRLQVQERLTEQVADAVVRAVAPVGVAVVVEASHLCMMMRGVQKQNSRTVTSSMRGALLEDSGSREEFLRLARARNP